MVSARYWCYNAQSILIGVVISQTNRISNPGNYINSIFSFQFVKFFGSLFISIDFSFACSMEQA